MCTHRGGATTLGTGAGAAATAASGQQLSDGAQAAIARMTNRLHYRMSWARPFVRSDADILRDVQQQVPGANGFTIHSTPDAQGYADVWPTYTAPSNAHLGRMASTAISAVQNSQTGQLLARQRAQQQRATAQQVNQSPTVRVRVIRNRSEEDDD